MKRDSGTAGKIVRAVLYPLLTLLGVVGLYGPSNLVWGKAYMYSFLRLTMGDHVQITYYLWLWWHALVTASHLPWLDPFQFAATGHLTYHPSGWPLVLLSLPVQAISGPIAAFNAVFYASFIAAAGTMYLWIRELGLSRPAAAVAGFAFAFAPFRIAQLPHANALLAFLLPLCLFTAERALRGPERSARIAAWSCAVCFVSLTASGDMHLVVYFAPFFAVYCGLRMRGIPRDRLARLALPAAGLVIGSIALVFAIYWLTFRPSARSMEGIGNNPANYAPRIYELIRRFVPTEHMSYPGVLTALAAIGGAIVGVRDRVQSKRHLVVLLAAVVPIAYILAWLPGLGPFGLRVYKALPVLSLIQVPGRILILATLALAALAAVLFAKIDLKLQAPAAVLVMGLILVEADAPTRNQSATSADGDLMPAVPPGAGVLDLPPFPGGHATGSRYQLQIVYNPGPRVGGYSVVVTPAADRAQRQTFALAKAPIDPCRWMDISRSIKFDYVAVHTRLYGRSPIQWRADPDALLREMDSTPGFSRVSRERDVVTYRFEPKRLLCRRR